MGRIIKHRKQLLTRFSLWLFLIVILGISPLLIGLTGAYISECLTGEPCHEANCVWMTIPWLTFTSVPISVFVLVIYLLIVGIDIFKLSKKHGIENDSQK